MRALNPFLAAIGMLGYLMFAASAMATDHDGANDCSQFVIEDWGDAPEGVLAYPGVIGKFPTCRAMNLVGTREIGTCMPISSPPGITGHIFHHQDPSSGPSYWLGCHQDALGAPMGIDREFEGVVNQPANGTTFCGGGDPSDCTETAYGLTWDQDECYGGNDAGLSGPPTLTACQPSSVAFSTYSCAGGPLTVFLNVAIDMNQDGDWNDALLCPAGGCAYEWAVKNQVIALPAGCGSLSTPAFLVGPTAGPSWMRISLSSQPVSNDYPWAGTAGHSGTIGGETEDYPAMIEHPVPAVRSSWGEMKVRYR